MDAGGSHTYALVAGDGSTGNGAFTILGNELKTAGALDFETQSGYSIRVRGTDQDGLSADQVFAITVTDVNEAPTALALSNTSVANNAPVNTVVGTLTSTDPDAGDTHAYSLVSGNGDTDNTAFTIVGDELRMAVVTDQTTKPSYSIRVHSTDADGLFTEDIFTITVNA